MTVMYTKNMEFYHVLNRGVEKRPVIKNDSDRLRFVHSLFIFNDARPLDENHARAGFEMSAVERKPLVHLHAWCLMPNHYHLLISPLEDDLRNLSRFMKKLNMGYARYFNEKYDRSGYLWQGRYKKVHMERDAHFIRMPSYIHLNPLDIFMPEWRNAPITNTQKALDHLANYRWSSHLDYASVKNFPSIISKDLLTGMFSSPNAYLDHLRRTLSTGERVPNELTLEA